MNMHNTWLLKETNLTINFPSNYCTEPKYFIIVCGILKLIEVCDNRDANTFDIISFERHHLTYSVLLLNLAFDLPRSLTWFESCFKFFNHDFVCGIKHLPYQPFRHWFLNFECHNEHYQEHFFNDFLGHGHCTKTWDICIEHDSAHFSRVNYELSRLRLVTLMRNQMIPNSVHSPVRMNLIINHSNVLHLVFLIINVLHRVPYLSFRNHIFIVFPTNLCYSTLITLIWHLLTKPCSRNVMRIIINCSMMSSKSWRKS